MTSPASNGGRGFDRRLRELLLDGVQVAAAQVRLSDGWAGSPWGWLLGVSSRVRGQAMREIMAHVIGMSLGPVVPDLGLRWKDNLLHLDGWEFTVKTSTLWSEGHYTFQQIRPSADPFILWGMSPDCVHMWVGTAQELRTLTTAQHGEDSRWLEMQPDDKRLAGGTLAKGLTALYNYLRMEDNAT
jgi:hypothetical protein